ncbi:sugar phosphate isomerase/epimerase family protein [Croceitalea rosinachiae]|uniref:Sugar phosphate isomerase/epimerase family protein n=1 Tax=Croceitalea rosinachiae TaxID=3075596 RepID=A0ABU3A7A8_9FLAO|nr:sugar phosphate isomerase/epimerase family protein [Croceitalea sp. F388]MDT0606057.1 sugar phosphate isomerase/epimerase family protein [Croceitalea sp. F388]
MNRRKFVNKTAKTGLAITFLGGYACKQGKKEVDNVIADEEISLAATEPFFKLSLAQWSINKMIREGGVDPYTFAEKAANWGFSGLEYVSQLYKTELEAADYSEEAMKNFVDKCNAEAEKYGLENVLIMIDRQGDLAAADEKERKVAVENHYKWVDAAAAMGCHSIRVNLNGVQEPEGWMAASVDGLTQLATYAKDKKINIIVENHGGLSSNAAMLANVMTTVNMDNCGTLPDFGNFCVKRESGDYYDSKCIEEYDKYQGVAELMPHAKAVSAKAYDFDENGDETKIDYSRILKLVKEAGYTGYVGVEYEGSNLSEEEGILATKNLLIKAGSALA